MYYRLFCLILMTGICCAPFISGYAEDKPRGERLIGGPCEYRVYPGRAKITSIAKEGSVQNEQERYAIKFLFYPDQEVKERHARVEGREFSRILNIPFPSGQNVFKESGIEVDKLLDCNLKVIVKGTCTPLIFEFPSFRLQD